jgi:membrane associated rhomboid family serine protease
MSESSEISVRVTREHRLAEEWELVLVAEGLTPTVRLTRAGIILSVPEKQVERALAALAAYERENAPQSRQAEEPIGSAGLVPGIGTAAALLLFFFVTDVWMPNVPWFERGGADANRILQGEIWRTVTSLTLHVDIVHALSNAVGAAVFFSAVFGMLGPGVGSALVLLAGAAGNLANAVLHGSPHFSVGASTSVFAAVGVLGGLGVLRRWRKAAHRRRAWMPIAAALALLAMLGSGGERVDVWAHLFGLLLGGVSGILVGFTAPHPPPLRIQWACGSAALALLIYGWILALR